MRENALAWLRNYLGESAHYNDFCFGIIHGRKESVSPLLTEVVTLAKPTANELILLAQSSPIPMEVPHDREWEARFSQELGRQAYEAIENAPEKMKIYWQKLATLHYARARRKLDIDNS